MITCIKFRTGKANKKTGIYRDITVVILCDWYSFVVSSNYFNETISTCSQLLIVPLFRWYLTSVTVGFSHSIVLHCDVDSRKASALLVKKKIYQIKIKHILSVNSLKPFQTQPQSVTYSPQKKTTKNLNKPESSMLFKVHTDIKKIHTDTNAHTHIWRLISAVRFRVSIFSSDWKLFIPLTMMSKNQTENQCHFFRQVWHNLIGWMSNGLIQGLVDPRLLDGDSEFEFLYWSFLHIQFET